MAAAHRLMVIDGHSLAFRAFHALANANLRTSSGEPTYAVFGFAQLLLTSIQEHRPHYLAVAFDVGRTFRDDLYAEYKAGRRETPAEFHPQLERIQKLLHALSIPIYTAEGFEADDVIGTLARQASSQHLETLILTGDTDTLQLVDEHVRVVLANPYGKKTTTTVYDAEQVRERYQGLQPGQLADLRGLKGDTSDNIPGVKGIGEKGAINLLKEFGSVESLFDNLDTVPTRYRKALEGQREQALFSKRLAVIVCDAPVTLDTESARLDTYDRNTVMTLFQELEFGKTLIEKLPVQVQQAEVQALPSAPPSGAGSSVQMRMFGEEAASAPPVPARPNNPGYRSATSEADLHDLLAELTDAPHIAFDAESTGLDTMRAALVGLSLATRPGTGWYIPVGHASGDQLPRQQVLAALRPFLEDPRKPKYAHHARFDIELLQQAGIRVQGLAFDVLLVARLLGKQQVGLKELAFYELKPAEPMTEISELIGKGAKQKTFDQVPIEQATPYAAADADMTLRLTEHLRPQLAAEPRLQDLFDNLELPLVPILVAMETAGIAINLHAMQELHERLGSRLAELQSAIYAQAGSPFNINSGPQLNEVLFERLGLPTEGLSKTKSTGRYSLTADALERMADSHEIVRLILKYRQFAKLKSTYVDALPGLVNPQTGRIHTTYNQIGTTTGRIASQNPNLQNIPVRTDEGGEIRRAFVAAPGHRFLAADYSQIELRVLAHITQDPQLMQVFHDGRDIHAATAAQLFGLPPEQIDKHQRRIAKSVVFGVIYGISSFGLSQRIGLERREAQALIDALFARFPGIRTYIDSTLEQGRRDGFVQSLFGRRRLMPELASSGPRRAAAEREAINAPIQATAADIMKLAMIQVSNALHEHQLQTRMLLQVHDELIFEVPHHELDAVQQLVREKMESAASLRVPLKVDVEIGDNWEAMEPV